MRVVHMESPSATELGPEWSEIVGDRKISEVFCADFGLADAQIALLCFVDGTYEVGHGECLRPYNLIYQGKDYYEASEAWLKAIADLL